MEGKFVKGGRRWTFRYLSVRIEAYDVSNFKEVTGAKINERKSWQSKVKSITLERKFVKSRGELDINSKEISSGV